MPSEKFPKLAADAVVNLNTKILLIQRKNDPFKGRWALPGGFVEYKESPEVAVLRELYEETNLKGKNPRLIGVFGHPDRDPRGHVVSVSYSVEVEDVNCLKGGDDAKEAKMFDLSEVMAKDDFLAFDHKKILEQYLNSKK